MKNTINLILYLLACIVIGLCMNYVGFDNKIILTFFVGLFAFLVLYGFSYQIYFLKKEQKIRKRMKNDFDFDGALHFYDKVLKNRSTELFKAVANMNRAFIFYHKGDFEQSILIMKGIEPFFETKAKGAIKLLYYNNLLSYYLDSGKLEEAKALYKNKGKLLVETESTTKNNLLKRAIESTLIQYNIEFGDVARSREKLLTLLPNCKAKLNRIEMEYTIAVADIKLGNKEEAKARMKKIYNEAKGTFFHKKIADFLKRSL